MFLINNLREKFLIQMGKKSLDVKNNQTKSVVLCLFKKILPTKIKEKIFKIHLKCNF